jgi:hypothetical protein
VLLTSPIVAHILIRWAKALGKQSMHCRFMILVFL